MSRPSSSGPTASFHSSTTATTTPISGSGTPIRLTILWARVITVIPGYHMGGASVTASTILPPPTGGYTAVWGSGSGSGSGASGTSGPSSPAASSSCHQ